MVRWIVAAGLVAAGCGGGYTPAGAQKPAKNVVPVVGTLTYQGKPLENYMVSFIPKDGGHNAVGVTDATGNFILGTNKPRDGAAIGSYGVAVAFVGPPPDADKSVTDAPPDPDKLPKAQVTIPTKYTDAN